MLTSQNHRFRPLLSDPARSPTLPGFYYSDPDVFVAETQHIFRKQWQLVAHISELEKRGSFLCTHIADEHIIIMRGQDDLIRGFYNVCSHRAHELLSGSGCVKSLIICPYHAWTFNTQGELHGARYSNHMPNFDKADYGLTSVRVETIMGFVFANLDPLCLPIWLEVVLPRKDCFCDCMFKTNYLILSSGFCKL